MEQLKNEITDILVNHDKERTLLSRRFNMYLSRGAEVKCKTYSMFIMGFGIGMCLMYIIGEIR